MDIDSTRGPSDSWAFAPRSSRRGGKRISVPLIAALTVIFTVALSAVAVADDITADGDTVSPSPNIAISDCTVLPKTFGGSATIKYSGNNHFASGANLTLSVTPDQAATTAGITASGPSSTTLPDPWGSGGTHTVTGYSTTIPAGIAMGTYKITYGASGAKAGGGTLSISDFFNVNITVDCSAPTNNPPTVTAGGPYSGGEGSAIALNGASASDDDGTVVSTTWTIQSQTSAGTCNLANANSLTGATLTCTDNGSVTVRLTATDDDGASAHSDAIVTVNNVAPTVTASITGTVDCRQNATLSLSFSDPGVNDGPWAVEIDWGDGSTNTTFDAASQGAQPDQTHTYVSPGSYTAVVSVTDKDGGVGSDGDNTVTVEQVYTVDFLPPFDDSSTSGLIVNKMKNGRVVPVKATIYDVCTESYLTDPSASVTIKVSKTSGTGTGDPIEEYADAGSSSAGTNAFRWSDDGFWIYNLDSKALGLVVNNTYRVDIYVAGVKATRDVWAALQPVK